VAAPAETPEVAAEPVPAAAAAPVESAVIESARTTPEPEHVSPTAGDRIRTSPLARRVAEENRVDLSKVKGTGPGGRIVSEDVESYLAKSGAAPAAAKPAPTVVAAPVASASAAAAKLLVAPAAPPKAGEVVELSRIRRTINERLSESNATVPTFYVTSEIDMGAALDLRAQLNAAWAPDSASVTDVIVRAVALALAKFPAVNSSIRAEGLERRAQVSVGIAVSLADEALMVPVIRDADRKGLREIGRESKVLIERARAGKPSAGDLGGASLSISNLGMLDVEDFVAIITPPESAILAIGSTRQVPAVVDGEIKIARRMRVTLSGDHRVFAGETGARFMMELKRLLQTPLDLLQ
jgi:pyruvate dehydrogenase E2 component (dihydrolipoamide acetyltransferase)